MLSRSESKFEGVESTLATQPVEDVSSPKGESKLVHQETGDTLRQALDLLREFRQRSGATAFPRLAKQVDDFLSSQQTGDT